MILLRKALKLQSGGIRMKNNNCFKYGSKELHFNLKNSNRKTLGITVNPDTTITITAPQNASHKQILTKVENRAKWILKQIDYFESFLPRTPSREYVSGETHLYLGKQYKLKVIHDNIESIKLQHGLLIVKSNEKTDSERTKKLIIKWYNEHSGNYFNKKFRQVLLRFDNEIIEKAILEIKRMNKRWGSCTPSGKIIINPEIIKAPSKCIEYVMVHELCHIKYPHHGNEFYLLLEKLMPDWKRWKNRLEKIMV